MPMWRPQTEADLVSAAEQGLLDESGTSIELKRELGLGAAANKELAKDLASLAISGGLLLLGVRDVQDRDPSDPLTALNPVPLSGFAERVEQVALTRCEPPLFVRCIDIAAEEQPSMG